MTMINVISKKEEGEPMTVHLKSGVMINGNFKEVKDGLLKMTNVYVACHGYNYKSSRVIMLIDAVEMFLPGIQELTFPIR